MTTARHYWLSTNDPRGAPHARPVDGIWIDDALFFGGSPQARWFRNLVHDPRACVHLEDAEHVVILHGTVLRERPAPDLAVRLARASNEKYGYGQTPEQYQAQEILVLRPARAYAWNALNEDATRWRCRGG